MAALKINFKILWNPAMKNFQLKHGIYPHIHKFIT